MKNKIIYAIVFLLLVAGASAMDYYNIDVTKNNESLSYKSVAVKPSLEINLSDMEMPNRYVIEIISFDDKVLKRLFFDFDDEILVESVNPETGSVEGGETIKLDNVTKTLMLPYYANAKEIDIFIDFKQRLVIDVSSFAKNTSHETKIKPVIGYQENVSKITQAKTEPAGYIGLAICAIAAIILFAVLMGVKRKK